MDPAEWMAEQLAEAGLLTATVMTAAQVVADQLAGGEWRFGGWCIAKRRTGLRDPKPTRGVTIYFWRPIEGAVKEGIRDTVETVTFTMWDGEAQP